MNCSDFIYGQATSTATLSGTFVGFAFAGKEKDLETGLSYFGARYYDADLTTGWLSVDPMSDKYPSMSPYGYCAWNPVKLVDPDGDEMYPTEKLAGNDRAIAVRLFGKENVSNVYNRGTSKNPDYVFDVRSPKSVNSKQPVKATISSAGDLRKYEFGEAPRKNVISSSLTFGIQADAKYLGINLISADLLRLDIDPEKNNPIMIETAKEGSAHCSSGVTICGFSYSHGYAGGDYVDPLSRTNTFSYSVIGINWTNGDVVYGMSGSFILGFSVKVISKIIKE